jgi:hypothetical protein
MCRPRFTILGLFFATSFVALMLGLFISAWRVHAARSPHLTSHVLDEEFAPPSGPPLFPTSTFVIGFAAWAAAWGVVLKHQANRSERPGQLDRHTPPAPLGIRLCWGLMVVGGLVAVAMPIVTMFLAGPLLFPTFYFSLLVGLIAISRGVAGDTQRLRRTAALQLANLVALDPANVVFAAMEYALLRTARVQEYLRLSRG